MVTIKFLKISEDAQLPTRANDDDAGFDIRAIEDYTIRPRATAKVGTGFKVEVPRGYELQVRSKSGMAYKEGLVVAQGTGTIDSGYRGEVCVLLYNRCPFTRRIKKGEQIAQVMLRELVDTDWEEVDKLSDAERAEKGFGSTKEQEKTLEKL
jgi:dUTP pyrophosphatase